MAFDGIVLSRVNDLLNQEILTGRISKLYQISQYELLMIIRSHNENLEQSLRYDMTIIPKLQTALAKRYGFDDSNESNKLQVLSNGVHIYPYQYFDQPGYTSMKDVVCIHRVAQSWNPNAKGVVVKKSTDVKKKTLGYCKMRIQQKLAKFILGL